MDVQCVIAFSRLEINRHGLPIMFVDIVFPGLPLALLFYARALICRTDGV